jgi:hypothetical protein
MTLSKAGRRDRAGATIKEFRDIATRYDKTDSSYEANWYLAAAIIAGR